MWWSASQQNNKPRRIKRRYRRRATSITPHYQAHKEAARAFVEKRLQHYNGHYQLAWNRVAIRNQRRCWGSCTSLKNLNFSYRVLFLPPDIADYIIVHELCHLQELHHQQSFWDLVSETLPDYKERVLALRRIERGEGF